MVHGPTWSYLPASVLPTAVDNVCLFFTWSYISVELQKNSYYKVTDSRRKRDLDAGLVPLDTYMRMCPEA